MDLRTELSRFPQVQLFDIPAKTTWLSKLYERARREGLNPEVLTFALEGDSSGIPFAAGANRNTTLLRLIGQRFVSSDDDLVFDVRQMPPSVRRDSLQISPHSPYHVRFFRDDEDMAQSVEGNFVSPEKFIRAHAEALNTAAVSASGIWGDCGGSSPRMIFGLSDKALAQLCENQISNALESRMIWRQCPTHTQTVFSPFMGGCVAFNNELELPPFFPIGRNEDGVYAYALKTCLPQASIAHLGYSLLHAPLDKRKGYADTLKRLHLRINDFVALIWAEISKMSPAQSTYEKAGHYFKTLDVKEAFSILARQMFVSRMERLESQKERLSGYKKSQGMTLWLMLADRELLLMNEALKSQSLGVPEELSIQDDPWRQAQQWTSLYGELLKAWPHIRSWNEAELS